MAIASSLFPPRQLLQLYIQQDYELLSDHLLQGWSQFEQNTYLQLDRQTEYAINTWVETFLYLFCQPDYILSDRHITNFIQFNLTISNVVAISGFGTTDTHLRILLGQENNFAKLLTLFSARNSVQVERAEIFAASPELACLWYSCYLQGYRSMLVNETADRNLKAHLRFQSQHLTEFYHLDDLIFGSTYIDHRQDRQLKQQINQSIQKSEWIRSSQIQNLPNPKKIAIITSLWFSKHSVYRILSNYVDSLKQDFELTLIHLGEVRNNIQIEGFKSIRYIYFKNGVLDLEAIQENDFMVVYFPDVGMSLESILLANLRIAPIQICGTGHSVSTFGADIDYYISGVQIEENHQNYSEKLVLLPDMAAIHNSPDYKLQNPVKSRSEFIINCSWYGQKVNHEMLLVLKQIIEETAKPLLFRFFAGGALMRRNDFLPFVQDLTNLLGREYVEVFAPLAYDDYMAKMEEGDICIESYPFGGCNMIVDGLFLRKPTVTWEGDRWYNRIGSQTMRLAGCPDLIAKTSQEYIDLILVLIHDHAYRAKIQQHLQQLDLNATIFNPSSKIYFKQAIDFLIKNHEYLRHKDRQAPVRIPKA